MKILAFYPVLMTHNSEKAIEDMKKYGFQIIHERNNFLVEGDSEYVLEDNNGHRIDIVNTPDITEDMHAIRVNVDDFDEAVKAFGEDGYTVALGPTITESSKNVILRTPGNQALMVM